MPEAPLNPWLEEKLKEVKLGPEILPLVVEIGPKYMEEVQSELAKIPDVTVGAKAFNIFVSVRAPIELIPAIQRIPHVVKVHYEMPRYIYEPPMIVDPLIGEIRLSKIEIPYSPFDMLARLPFTFAQGLPRTDIIAVPTGKTREIIEAPYANVIDTKVAVLDTGLTPIPPLIEPRIQRIDLHSTTGEPPLDGLGHGQWCHTCAFGSSFKHPKFGLLKGVAFARDSVHVKCLSNTGFGSTMFVLRAMEYAYIAGCKIVSMSLGGPLQGSVRDDPECRIIEALKDDVIFVVAAGNEGPDEWTIGSPAASPFALTIGSYSPHYGDVAIFSSRGPSAEWYKNHPDDWGRDLAQYGEDLIGPDCLAPGGGPVAEGQIVDMIVSGVVGWCDGMYDLPFDAFDLMRGTSMSCPHAAGLVALLYDRGKIRTATDVKRVLKEKGLPEKTIDKGYGLVKYGMFE